MIITNLFDYQLEGAKFLRNKNFAMLADQMGVGKTAQAIEASKDLSRILVVCPAVAKYNWQKEFRKFGNRESEVAEGGHNKWNRPIAICSFEYAKRFQHKYRQYPRDLVIVDEGHFLKTPGAARTQAILGGQGLLHSTKRLWTLTGTPAPNHAGELWVWLYTFGYTKLSYDGFTARYCNCSTVGGSRYSRLQIHGTNVKHAPELKAMLKQFCLRRLKKDVLKDLPPIWHTSTYVEPSNRGTKDLKKKLQQEWEKLSEEIDFKILPKDDRLLDVLQGMSQSISSLRRYHGLTKVGGAADLIDQELTDKAYTKLVVFGIHTDVLETLRDMLKDKYQSVTITGKTPAMKRQEYVERFQKDPECTLFFGNILAAGTAITLTASHNVVFIEQDWVPGNNAQAADRCHRIGQEESVTVRHLMIRDSLDERIVGILTRKTQELSTFI